MNSKQLVVCAILLALLLAACAPAASIDQPTPTSTALPATTLAPALAPADAGCSGGESAEIVEPQLSEVQPSQIAPGGKIKVLGSGGYVRCDEAGYNESARPFQLVFDEKPVGEIVCYVNHCETELTVPADATSGIHTISVEGGSSITIEVVQP